MLKQKKHEMSLKLGTYNADLQLDLSPQTTKTVMHKQNLLSNQNETDVTIAHDF